MPSAQTNLSRSANQAQLVGNPAPPNMARISDGILNAASPAGFNLLNLRTDNTASDAAAASCRQYKDIEGLRKLQRDQVGRTHYQPGCGWRYKPSNGIVPEINQAALGTANGPSLGQPGSPDEVVGGTKWYWNLGDAEREITTKICSSASKCKQLYLLGRYTDVCGYCKTTGAMIPVERSGQTFSARYSDQTLGCARADITTATTGSCAEGFVGSFGTAGGRPSVPNGRGDLSEAFQVRREGSLSAKEGFVDLDALNNCMESPLSRDCVILAARTAGCSDDGTLIKALKNAGAGDYDNQLKTSPVYGTYKSVAAPGITNATLKDGSVALNVALDDFGTLVKNTQSQNQKLALSARDLCIRSGEFDNYDFCSEMRLTTVIDRNNISCVQKFWLQMGGTPEGTEYPTLSKVSGKTFQTWVTSAINLHFKAKSLNGLTQDKLLNAEALKQFFGTDSLGTVPSLPRNENTRGAETVWFDYGINHNAAAPPVILRCDLRLAKDKSILNGEVVPHFVDPNECMAKYNFPSADTKAYTSAFEIRSDMDQKMNFAIGTDDGMMISVNQNPFEGTAHRGNDWGSWAHQGPTYYASGKYPVNTEKSGKTNTVVTKWFNGYGYSRSHSAIQVDKTAPHWKNICDSEVYLTQEPLAPWLQYEVCTRPNNRQGNANGFFEKRFNGPCAMNYSSTPFTSFDVEAKGLVIQTDKNLRVGIPKGLPYISFTSSSSWRTLSYIHVNAVRTYTILFRPKANLANGQMTSIFYHSNWFPPYGPRTFYAYAGLINNNGQYGIRHYSDAFGNRIDDGYMPVRMNEWNLLVIQYVGDDSGVRKINMSVESIDRLRDARARSDFSAALRRGQTISGPITVGNPLARYVENAGIVYLGALPDALGFTGDIAWLHGFRNYLDTEALLKSEVEQSWVSRWPRGNLDSEEQPKFFADVKAQQNTYGNNGTVSCDRYCRGPGGGGPWNNELPREWNGAKCVGTPNNPGVGCNAGFNGQLVCLCEKTGTGWA